MVKKISYVLLFIMLISCGLSSVDALYYGIELRGNTKLKVGEGSSLIAEYVESNDVYATGMDIGEIIRRDVSEEVIWSCSDDSILKLSDYGFYEALDEGIVTVTATYNLNGEVISDSIEVTVISSSSLNDLSKTDYFVFAFVAVFIICIGIAIPFLNKAGK